MIHPATRILAFCAFVTAVVNAGPAALFACAALAAALAAAVGAPAPALWRLLRRSRWLFLSIALIYLWLTPGRPLLEALGGYSPTLEGTAAGVQRVAALAVIVLSVHVLLASTRTDMLVSGLAALVRPLAVVGFPAERFALRVALTLDYAAGGGDPAPPGAGSGGYRERLGERVAGAWQRAIARAERGEPASVELARPGPPGLADAGLLVLPLLPWLL